MKTPQLKPDIYIFIFQMFASSNVRLTESGVLSAYSTVQSYGFTWCNNLTSERDPLVNVAWMQSDGKQSVAEQKKT